MCPLCGTESPATLGPWHRHGDRRHDLVAALRDVPDGQRGWQADKTAVKCQSCQAISVFDAGKIGQRCDFCGSAALVPYEQVKDSFRPESLLPLKVAEPQARDLIRRWYQRQWLAPNKLNARALTDTAKGIYLPYWTFDARTHAFWTADSGQILHHATAEAVAARPTPASGVHDSTMTWCRHRSAEPRRAAVEPFPPTAVSSPTTRYLCGKVERYTKSIWECRRQGTAADAGGITAPLRRGSGILPESRRAGHLHRAAVQAFVPVWLSATPTAQSPTRSSSAA